MVDRLHVTEPEQFGDLTRPNQLVDIDLSSQAPTFVSARLWLTDPGLYDNHQACFKP